MHPETGMTIARQRVADRTAEAERVHRLELQPHRLDLRATVGTALVRLGTKIARTASATPDAPAEATTRPSAGVTMAR